MLQYKTVHVVRLAEKKQVKEKTGFLKSETKKFTEYESWVDFHKRYEKILNEMAKEGWFVVNMQYNVPIAHSENASFSDYGKAEIFTLMARERPL